MALNKFFLKHLICFAGYFLSCPVFLFSQSSTEVSETTDSIIQLKEAVVVAYGTSNLKNYAGTVREVKSHFPGIFSTDFEQLLQGRISGLQFFRSSGQVGSGSQLRIRGTGSMNASNEPLYVVDGVPVTSGSVSQSLPVSDNLMNTLNPEDIQSITILKDAAASSLYGSRAANGVVLITTKKGVQGKTKIKFSANLSFTPDFAYNNFETCTPEEMHMLVYENRYNEYIDQGKSPQEAATYAQNKLNGLFPQDTQGYYDWENALLRTAIYQNYNVSVAGGNDITKYYSSLSYSGEQGRSFENELQRISGRLNVLQNLNRIFSLGSNIYFSKIKRSMFKDTRDPETNYFYGMRNLLFQDWQPEDQAGNPVTTRYPSYAYNYPYYSNLKDIHSDIFKASAIETLGIRLLPSLNLKSIFSYDQTQVNDFSWFSPQYYGTSSTNGEINEHSTQIVKWVSSNTLNYKKTFNKYSIDALLGFEAEKNKTEYVRATGKQLSNSYTRSIASAGSKDATTYSYDNSMMSLFSNLLVSYDDHYSLSCSFRRDGSSRLGPDTRWGNFWSTGALWRISKESFMENTDFLDDLHLKLSYGVNGTQPINNYGYMSLYSLGYIYNGQPGGITTTLGNEMLTWENNHVFNISLGGTSRNNRFYGSVVYYTRNTDQLLQDVQLSRITGISTQLDNAGSINNQGIEIDLSGTIITTRNWIWTLNMNLSTLKSKVTHLYDRSDVVWYDNPSNKKAQFIYKEGYSPKSFYGAEWAGVDPENGKAMWYLNNEESPDLIHKGRPVTYSQNKADYVIIGCADPQFYGGINSDLYWKNITLSLHFIYSVGGDAYNATGKDNQDDGYYNARVMSKKALNRWQNPGDQTDTPRRTYDQTSAQGFQSRWISNNDYIRLKSIQLSYQIPTITLTKTPFSGIRFFANAANLLTWAKEKEYDPEVDVLGIRGWEMPIGKTYAFGVDIEF